MKSVKETKLKKGDFEMNKQEGIEFLDWLRENGAAMDTNRVFHLVKRFGITREEANEIQKEWVGTLTERMDSGDVPTNVPRKYSKTYRQLLATW